MKLSKNIYGVTQEKPLVLPEQSQQATMEMWNFCPG